MSSSNASSASGSDDASAGNLPGQPAISYRLGTYSSFLQQLQQQLATTQILDAQGSGQRPLAALTTRATDDPVLAVLDAWAVVGDVLSFYQERIANEGYLRTATQRRSLVELAGAVGYQ